MGCDTRHKCYFSKILRFNPRTHMGCDYWLMAAAIASTVSIHAPTWGATVVPDKVTEKSEVSIHAPTWGATNKASEQLKQAMFQSTHPHGVRLLISLCQITQISFNPRTHMGCDVSTVTMRATPEVSIHAPTWGATTAHSSLCCFQSVSIHAPTWGATAKSRLKFITEISFNPRTHMGCDLRLTTQEVVSRCFNPRTHMGCDIVTSYPRAERIEFQSTHPHGVRRNLNKRYVSALEFQSTHPHGVRHLYRQWQPYRSYVSIHAPTWGATKLTAQQYATLKVSIHAPTWGATQLKKGSHTS